MAKAGKKVADPFELDDHDAMETLVEKAIDSIDELDRDSSQSDDADLYDGLEELEEEEDENIHVSTVRYAQEDEPLQLENAEPQPRPTVKKSSAKKGMVDKKKSNIESSKKSKKQKEHLPEAQSDDDWQDYGSYEAPLYTGYARRWFAGQFGFITACCAYAGVQWDQLQYTWNHLLDASSIPVIEHYAAVAGSLWLIAIVVSAILAAFDRSAIRCVQLGIAWAAITIISVTALSVRHPAHITADDRLHTCAMMLQASLAPAIHAHVFEEMSQDHAEDLGGEGLVPSNRSSGEKTETQE
ncbi:MAG: hypothetical protein HRU15_15750 [Planctomycetes bacterium]|nr:hypothetical protein [Planctomycetota bacterium]